MKQFLLKNKFQIILFFVFLISTIFFSSDYLINWDAGQYALGTEYYDLNNHQPHTPGYFLFVKEAQALNYFITNINICFLIINFIAGALAIYFLYKLILLISQNKKTSFIIALLFIINPVFWYYHNIANTYTFEALAIILTSYFTYKAFLGQKNTFIYSLGAIALLMGFRPSIIIITLPLLIIQFVFAKQKLKNSFGIVVFAIIFAAWFIPFSHLIGFENFLQITKDQLQASSTAFSQKSQIVFLIKSILLSFNVLILLLLINLKQNYKFLKEKKLFYFLIPSLLMLLFFAFVHIGEVGYILSIIPIFYLFIIWPIQYFSKKTWGIAFIILILIMQISIFIWPQTIFKDNKIKKINFSSIKQHDKRIFNYTGLISAQNPNTLILVLRGQYLDEQQNTQSYQYDDVRILGYYLHDHKLYDFSGVTSEYSKILNFQTEKVFNNQIQISQNTNKILIVADYINPIDYPDEFLLEENQIPQTNQMYYTGNIAEIEKFEFKGFFFSKEK